MRAHMLEGWTYDDARRIWTCPDDLWARRHADHNSFACYKAYVDAMREKTVRRRAPALRDIPPEDRITIHMLDAPV